MKSPADLYRLRRKRRAQAQRSPLHTWRQVGVMMALAASLALAVGTVVLAAWYVQLTANLPSQDILTDLLNEPDGLLLQPTRFYDRTGEQVLFALENPAARPRRALTLDPSAEDYIPKVMVDAVVAAIDPDFWQHPGFTGPLTDPRPTTIAHRLVSDLVTWQEPEGERRALRERLLAAQITVKYGRDQVMAWYLNSANFGKLAYGVSAAAELYFGIPASELSLSEAALLAGILDAPALNPVDTVEVAYERQAIVLQSMASRGMITSEEAASAAKAPRTVRKIEGDLPTSTTAFLRLVTEQLETLYTSAQLERGGFRVITTLDLDLQTQAACVVEVQLQRFTTGATPESTPAGTSVDSTACPTARLLPPIPGAPETPLVGLAGSVVVSQPQTGQILALVGMDSGSSRFHTRPRTVAPGSLLTPYVYLNAFTRGASPATMLWDIPAYLPPEVSENPNPDQAYHGPVRIRTALANDYLVPALQVLAQTGPETVWKTAQQLGLPSLEAPVGADAQALILNGGGITLVEAGHAFGVFGTQGVLTGYPRAGGGTTPNGGTQRLEPNTILRVEDARGKLLLDIGPPQARPVISAQLAYILVNILSDEAARWDNLGHPNVLEIGRPVAVKQGRTNDGRSTWTVGMTPQLVVAAWVGAAQIGETTALQLPPLAAAGIWNAITRYATRDLPASGWTPTSGITTLEVCDPSGQLPTADCPAVVREIFTPGSEPTEYDTLYRRFQINQETGNLATVFTPAGLVETRVYMVVPPEAASWAQSQGLPTPPRVYDLVSMPTTLNPNAQFSSPPMFASLRGMVSITGTAGGTSFGSYRIQVGQGLNPQQWLLVGEGQSSVSGGLLATWDTTGLNGLYAIRLQVVDKDLRTQTAILQVTVDNQPPTVEFTYPQDGAAFAYPDNRSITALVEAGDALAVDRVEIWVNDRLYTTLLQAPYAFDLKLPIGESNVVAIAFDPAGNQAETSLVLTATR